MIEVREYRPEDAAGYLAVRDTVWGGQMALTPRREIWEEYSRAPCTAAVAVENGTVVGGIPLLLRDVVIRPGISVRAAFEHSVCVLERLRGQNVGTTMMTAAQGFLKGRAAVMMVYRGDERSAGYRFYARTGHHDVTFCRSLGLTPTNGVVDRGLRFVERDEFLGRENEVLEVFHSAHGAAGGCPARVPGYHRGALRSLSFTEQQTDFFLLMAESAGRLAGYALLFRWHTTQELQIAELATHGGDQSLARRLLLAAAAKAAELGLRLVYNTPDTGLYANCARSLGFSGPTRKSGSSFLMAHVVDPAAVAGLGLAGVPRLHRCSVNACTPEGDYVLQAPDNPTQTITIEAKTDQLTRLLLCRLDLARAIEEERITVHDAAESDIADLAAAFPFCRWESHYLDYI